MSNLTPEQRARLVEVMATELAERLGLSGCDWPQCDCDHECERFERIVERYAEDMGHAIAAAERAGFRIEEEPGG